MIEADRLECEYWLGRLRDRLERVGLQCAYDHASAEDVPPAAEISTIQSESKAIPYVFYSTGIRSALAYLDEAEAAGKPFESCERIMEFGVGFARVLRHFAPFRASLFGCDMTPQVVDWCNQRLSMIGTFTVNDATPPLPYDAATFDVVYANSVFTHIRHDLTPEWIAELRRVVRDDGVVITSHYDFNEHLRSFSAMQLDMAFQTTGFIEWGSESVRENNIAYAPAELRRLWGKHFEVVGTQHHRDDQFHLICRSR